MDGVQRSAGADAVRVPADGLGVAVDDKDGSPDPQELVYDYDLAGNQTLWSSPGRTRRESCEKAFERITSPILTSPAKAFDWKVGDTMAQGFSGRASGKNVVVYVAKEGPYQGRVISAIVPDAHQVAKMGLKVSRVSDALTWSGDRPVVSLFVVVDGKDKPIPPALESTDSTAATVRTYHLEDEQNVLIGFSMYEYDLELDEIPPDLEAFLSELLRRACDIGRVAWVGFEGSFDFEHLLVDEVADQIFGVCVCGSEPEVALKGSVLDSDEWKATLRVVRSSLV